VTTLAAVYTALVVIGCVACFVLALALEPEDDRERRDRELERADSPLVWLDLCPLCGQDWCACWLSQPPAA
jgi:hypothetical protein